MGSAAHPAVLAACGNVSERFARDHCFSGIIAVADSGRLRGQWAFGLADRERSVANGTDTRFQVGSVSKWITTVALLMLVDDGEIDLAEPVGHYLTGYPAEVGDRVTLAHLLSNTSGIQDRLPTELINELHVATSGLSAAEAVEVYGYGPLVFPPGSAFDYSHTNWLLVQAIAEAVTGEALEDVLSDRLFRPLGLDATGVTHGSFETVPKGAIAYDAAHAGATRKLHLAPDFLVPTGKIYSDCGDLVRLAHAVHHGALLRPESLRALTTVRWAPEHYALGGRIRRERLGGAEKTIALELGSSGGFKAMLAHLLEDDLTVVALNNTHISQDLLTDLARNVLRELVGAGAPP